MSDGQRLEDTERAFVTIWSRFCGAWSRGELHERDGLTWFRTPIRHLPYNGVIRTRMAALDEALIDDVLAGYRERGVQCFWGLHTLSTPTGVAEALVAQGLAKVEAMTCMALDLAGWSAPALPGCGSAGRRRHLRYERPAPGPRARRGGRADYDDARTGA